MPCSTYVPAGDRGWHSYTHTHTYIRRLIAWAPCMHSNSTQHRLASSLHQRAVDVITPVITAVWYSIMTSFMTSTNFLSLLQYFLTWAQHSTLLPILQTRFSVTGHTSIPHCTGWRTGIALPSRLRHWCIVFCPRYLADLATFNIADWQLRQPELPSYNRFELRSESARSRSTFLTDDNSLRHVVRNIDSRPAFRRAPKSHFILFCL